MKIVLAGPVLTSALRRTVNITLAGAPEGTAATPIIPLAKGLLSLGHDVHVITTDPTLEGTVTISEGRFCISYCPLRGAPRYRARERAMDMFEREIGHLSTAIETARPDIVHAHWTYEFAEAAVRTKLPHLVTMHDLGWDYFWQFRDAYRFMRLIMKYRTMPRVRHLSVVAPFMASKARHYGYFGDVTVIPNGVSIPESPPSKAVDAERPVLVTVGNDGKIKNVSKSVEAFAHIRGAIPGSELHLFGPGLDSAYVNGAPGVIGHGNVDHPSLLDFLANRATMLIHPSRLETFGVIIAEAKSRSVPVIAGAQSGGVPYVCGVDAGCLLVDIEDPHAIADAALKVVASDRGYEQLSMQARADVEQRFSSDLVTKQYIALYDAILAQRHPAHQ